MYMKSKRLRDLGASIAIYLSFYWWAVMFNVSFNNVQMKALRDFYVHIILYVYLVMCKW